MSAYQEPSSDPSAAGPVEILKGRRVTAEVDADLPAADQGGWLFGVPVQHLTEGYLSVSGGAGLPFGIGKVGERRGVAWDSLGTRADGSTFSRPGRATRRTPRTR